MGKDVWLSEIEDLANILEIVKVYKIYVKGPSFHKKKNKKGSIGINFLF